MKIPKTKNESKLRHPPLAPVEELVLETKKIPQRRKTEKM
jgi:hypothetical protein